LPNSSGSNEQDEQAMSSLSKNASTNISLSIGVNGTSTLAKLFDKIELRLDLGDETTSADSQRRYIKDPNRRFVTFM